MRRNRSRIYTSGRRDNSNQQRDRYGRFERSYTPISYYDGYENSSDRRNYGGPGGNFYGQGNNYRRDQAGFSGRNSYDHRDDRRHSNGSSSRWNLRGNDSYGTGNYNNGNYNNYYDGDYYNNYERSRRNFADNWTDQDEDTNFRRNYDYENSYEEDREYQRMNEDSRRYYPSYDYDNRRRNWQENYAW